MIGFCSTGLTPGVTDQEQVNIESAQCVCKKGHFNPSDLPCNTDGWKIAQTIITKIGAGTNTPFPKRCGPIATAAGFPAASIILSTVSGLRIRPTRPMRHSRRKSVLRCVHLFVGTSLGYLSDNSPAPAMDRYALIHAFARYCYESKERKKDAHKGGAA